MMMLMIMIIMDDVADDYDDDHMDGDKYGWKRYNEDIFNVYLILTKNHHSHKSFTISNQ